MIFRDEWLLWSGLVLAVVAGALALRQSRPAIRFGPTAFARELPRSWRVRWRRLPWALHLLGLGCAVVALARPIERIRLPQQQRGIDIVLCIDGSSSMGATDMAPQATRLDLAKAAAVRFVAEREPDRIGVITFARYPDLRCPPSLDHAAVTSILDELQSVEPDGQEDMTGIGTAVTRAAQVLRRSPSPSRVVVLLTDGEENVATADRPEELSPALAAKLCEELGVRVYTIVVGLGKQERNGKFTPLDTSQVEALSDATDGVCISTSDAEGLEAAYARIANLEAIELEEARWEERDRFLPFLIAALVLVALSRTLAVTVWEEWP